MLLCLASWLAASWQVSEWHVPGSFSFAKQISSTVPLLRKTKHVPCMHQVSNSTAAILDFWGEAGFWGFSPLIVCIITNWPPSSASETHLCALAASQKEPKHFTGINMTGTPRPAWKMRESTYTSLVGQFNVYVRPSCWGQSRHVVIPENVNMQTGLFPSWDIKTIAAAVTVCSCRIQTFIFSFLFFLPPRVSWWSTVTLKEKIWVQRKNRGEH